MFLKNKNIIFKIRRSEVTDYAALMVSKKKNPLQCISVRMGSKNPSLVITDCHHSVSLVMPNYDPQDRFFISFKFNVDSTNNLSN